jgi:hypothetical protein
MWYIYTQIEVSPYIYRGYLLESEPEHSPRTRHRFGFSGKAKRSSSPEHNLVTSDDVLDSLTRHAASQVEFRQEHTHSLDLLEETEEPTLVSELEPPADTTLTREPKRLGHYVFAVMCAIGMITVWLYSSGKGALDPLVLSGIVARTGVQSIFANPLQIGIISTFALFAALWVALRRRASRLRLQI